MKVKDAIIKILKQEHITQKELSDKLGYARPTSLNTLLSTNNPNTDNLIKIMDALGYDIILKPKSGSDKVARSITLNNENKL